MATAHRQGNQPTKEHNTTRNTNQNNSSSCADHCRNNLLEMETGLERSDVVSSVKPISLTRPTVNFFVVVSELAFLSSYHHHVFWFFFLFKSILISVLFNFAPSVFSVTSMPMFIQDLRSVIAFYPHILTLQQIKILLCHYLHILLLLFITNPTSISVYLHLRHHL